MLNGNRWHVFTAIGGYIAVAIVDQITSDEVHEDITSELAWPIPPVARFTRRKAIAKKRD